MFVYNRSSLRPNVHSCDCCQSKITDYRPARLALLYNQVMPDALIVVL